MGSRPKSTVDGEGVSVIRTILRSLGSGTYEFVGNAGRGFEGR